MPWVETSRQPPVQYSNLTGFVGFRVFKVWGGVNRQMILSDPQHVLDTTYGPLPSFDSTWPGQDAQIGATLEQYSVETDGDVLHVTAVYTDRRQRDDFLSSFQTEREELQYAYRQPVLLPYANISGGTTAPLTTDPSLLAAKMWWLTTLVRYSTWYRIRKTVYLQLPPNQAADPLTNIDAPIAGQVNKIHNLGNSVAISPGSPAYKLFARFEGGDIQRLTWDRFKIAYSWTVESGVPWPGTSFTDIVRGEIISGGIAALDPNDFVFPRFASRLYGGGATDGQIYLRPPFEQVRSIPRISVDDPTSLLPPLFWNFMEYEIDESGFTQLPGLH